MVTPGTGRDHLIEIIINGRTSTRKRKISYQAPNITSIISTFKGGTMEDIGSNFGNSKDKLKTTTYDDVGCASDYTNSEINADGKVACR